MALSDTTVNGNDQIDERFIIQIRDQKFYIETWLYNQNPKFKPLGIPAFFIEQLVLAESLENWYVNGYIILANDFEVFERGSDKSPSPFFFRTDGRNKLALKIYPIVDSSTTPGATELDPIYWNMNFDFVIYDIEDVPTQSSEKKKRKYYFHDERFQIFMERNIEWSTALYTNNGSANGDDKSRSMNPSDAIKSIINTAASNQSDAESPVLMVGNSEDPSNFDEPNIPLNNFDESKWDTGNPDDLIFYTSPANSCVLDDLGYVSKYLKSSDQTPLFLLFDRCTRLWSLESLAKIFEKAQTETQLERLVIMDTVDPTTGKPYMPRAEYDQNGGDTSSIKNFQSNFASRIVGYRFSSMIAADEINFTNTPTYNYDFSKGEFNISFTNNTAKDFLNNFNNIASNSLYSFKKGQGQLLYQINQTKNTGLNVKNNFIPRTFFPSDASFLQMAKDFLFLNQAIHFSVPGLTFRSPGHFIFIDREASNGDPNAFDDRFLGQWMITKVTHVFDKNIYSNEIVANKVDTFNKWFDAIDSKY